VQGGQVNGSSAPVRFGAKTKSRIRVNGGVRLAVEAEDLLDGAPNRCGVYRSELWVDEKRWFAWQLDTLDFACNRDMNAHALYGAWERTGEQVHRLHRLPGNRLPIYESSHVSDVVVVQDSVPSVVEVKVWDVHGNFASEVWQLEADAVVREDPFRETTTLFPYDLPLKLHEDGATVSVPAGAFYEDYAFELQPMKDGAGITQWTVGSHEFPAVKEIRVGLPVDSSLQFMDGLIAGRMGRNGQVEAVYTGECNSNSQFEFETKTLGLYTLLVDSVSPVIRPHRRHSKSGYGDTLVVSNFHELRLDLADNLSGIESWEGSLNGDWILFRWDPKRERIWYELSDRRHPIDRTSQRLEIRAKDEAGNKAVWEGWVIFEPG
jgi:hypothetical protein